MFIPFETVRQHALSAIYRLVYSSNNQEYFTRSEIAEAAHIGVGTVFFGRALAQLVSEELVEASSWEDEEAQYTLTNAGWSVAEKIASSKLTSDEPVEGVPASDRVVLLSDNEHHVFREAIEDILEEVKSSNEVSVALGEGKERIQAELEAGHRLAMPKSLRLAAIVAVLATPLRFLVEKFSGEAVGELAKKLLELLWNMIKS